MKRASHPRTVKTLQQQQQQQQISKKVDEKKPSQQSYGASKILSKQHNKKDVFELQKPLITSFSCLTDVIRAYCNGTEEFQRLLDFECDLIYECKVCRSLYRSISNFVQHKKFHCNERYRDLEKAINGEISEKYTHINGLDPKGQLLATRKTTKKEVFELLQKVGTMSVEPLPDHYFTKDMRETEAALLNFFRQEGTAESEERVATIDADGTIVDTASTTSFDEQIPSLPRQFVQTLNGDRDAISSEAENQPPRLSPSAGKKTPSSSPSSSLSGSRRMARSGFRTMYQCPRCKKELSSMFNIYRHLKRVHGMTQEQIRKVHKKIKKTMTPVDDSPLLNSQKADSLNGNMVGDSSILYGPQPRVVLTKTSCPDGGEFPTPPSSDGTCQKRVATSPNALEDQSEGHHVPKKKLKPGSSLSWLKKGPSVPVVNGPLTRTARALYGSPSKVIQWDHRRGEDRNRSICSGGSTGEPESHNAQTDDESDFSSDDLQENETEPSASVKNGRRISECSALSDESIRRGRRSQSEERSSSISSSVSSLEDAAGQQLDSDDNDRQPKGWTGPGSIPEVRHGGERLVNDNHLPSEDVGTDGRNEASPVNREDVTTTVESAPTVDDGMLSDNVMEILFGSSSGARYKISYGSPDTDESS